MKKPSRSELDVFADLAALARAPGYVHAIAQICYRDNLVSYSKEMKASDLQKLFSRERLIRTEITTILGYSRAHRSTSHNQPRARCKSSSTTPTALCKNCTRRWDNPDVGRDDRG